MKYKEWRIFHGANHKCRRALYLFLNIYEHKSFLLKTSQSDRQLRPFQHILIEKKGVHPFVMLGWLVW